MNSAGTSVERAMFGAGCFWGIEEVFRHVRGVVRTTVGYAGGTTDSPTYEQVCGGTTGHAEVVLVEYDPSAVSYDELLDVFWHSHDPTQVNRQGPDVGEQYRSVIFYFTPDQREAALRSGQRFQEHEGPAGPIATHILPAPTFWRAEEYHQHCVQKMGRGVC